MTRVVVYRHTMEVSNPWLDEFCVGLAKHGIRPVRKDYETPVAADLAVFYGYSQEHIIRLQREHGGRCLVMEMGYVGDRELYQSLRFDGLNGRGWCPPAPDGGARWREHFGHLERPWRDAEGEYVLLVGQVSGDLATQHVDLDAWYRAATHRIKRAWPKWPVVFKPHPHPRASADRVLGVPVVHGPIDSLLDKAAIVVTCNSNVGVLAAIAGVPVVAEDRGAMAWPVASHDIGKIVMPDRTRWLHDIAWSQWRIEEMASGKAWEHLRQGLALR